MLRSRAGSLDGANTHTHTRAEIPMPQTRIYIDTYESIDAAIH